MFVRRTAAAARGTEMDDVDHTSAIYSESATSHIGTVGSLALTLTSTIADGLVHTLAHWKVLLLAQGVSLVLAIAGGTNEMLALECGVNAPSLYNAAGYTLICIFGGIIMFRRDKRNSRRGIGTSAEEQESFRNHSEEDANREGDGNNEYDHEHDDDDDDLTLDDDPPNTLFSRTANHQRSKDTSRRSDGSDSKLRPQHPFLCGMFTIHAKWYYYFAVSFIESQAYYLIFLAFRYTSFSFVYVSDALAIPSAMLFTKMLMRRRYLWTHLIGGAICVAGIVMNTVSDMSLTDVTDGLEEHADSDHIKGDVLAIVGAVLLGLDDVLSEIIVNNTGDVTEMIFMKGYFGAAISFIQLSIFERDAVNALFSREGSSCELSWKISLFVVHAVTRAMDVWGEMQFLLISEAALLNLLLLTSDLYAAIFDLVTVGITLTPYFYGAFFLICCGIVLYEAGPSPAEQHPPGTPIAIEFHNRGKKNEIDVASSTVTDHAGNLSENINGELT